MFQAAQAALPIAVVTTVGDREEATRIATLLVEQGLAACVQIGEIASVYAWAGELCNEREYRLVVKTALDRYAAVEAAIRAAHSYELPAIHAVRFERIHAPYAEWIVENSRGPR